MVKITRHRFESIGYVTDLVAVGELTEHHVYQPTPGVIVPVVLVGSGLANDFFDFITRQPCDCLCEKCYFCLGKWKSWLLHTKVVIYVLASTFFLFLEKRLGKYCRTVGFSQILFVFLPCLLKILLDFNCNTKLSESSDMAKSWAIFCCSRL